MKKLLEFQKRVTPIVKDSANSFYKSKYFDINSLLAEIRPILNELGLVLVQPLNGINGQSVLETKLIDADTGTVLVHGMANLPDNPDPQKMGATITYFRRYSLQSMLCLEAEDDDGNTASGRTVPPKPAYVPTNQPVPTLNDVCPDCGGKMFKSMKGNIVCANRCWLPENQHLRKPKIEDLGTEITPEQLNQIWPQ